LSSSVDVIGITTDGITFGRAAAQGSPAMVEDLSDRLNTIGGQHEKKTVHKKRYHNKSFKIVALKILAANGRKINEVADDLGISKSTLSKFKTHYTQVDLLTGPHDNVQKEMKRLRR
jgi:transposase-like protein